MSENGHGLDDVVRRYEQACRSGDGAELEQFLPPASDGRRLAALHELVKLDLEVQWRRGRQVRVEDYLPRFPELGTARTVPAELIVAEFRARTLYGDQPALDVYQRRFPDQFPECERLAREGALMEAPTEAKVAQLPAEVVLPVPKGPTKPPHAVGPGVPSPTPSFVPMSGGYQLLDKIGAGGFAEVWRAEAPGGFPAAVKILFRPLDHDEAQKEKHALDTIKRYSHPYLLQTQAYWEQEGRLYIAMELAEGSLRERLKECRKAGLQGIPAFELLRYMREAAEALDYLHGNGVQHRDLKPDNILLLRGHAKVGDFGLARLKEAQVTMSVTGSGTPAYMPPEAWAGKLHASSDLYSFAVTYVELRLDRRPFAGASQAELMMAHLQAKPDLSPLRAEEQDVILRALSREPTERYASCTEFVRALEATQPEELEPPRTQKSIEIPALPPESSEQTDPSAPRIAWRPPSNISDTDVRRTAWYNSWRGKKRGGALSTVLLLLACIPLVGISVAILNRLLNPPPKTISVKQTPGADRVSFLPKDFEKADETEVVTERGQRYYTRINRVLADGMRVPFVFVGRDEPGQPGAADIGAFYIMEDKVTYDLFTRFDDFVKDQVAREHANPLKDRHWERLPWKGKHPVLEVVADDAARCAQWLGGNLPSRREWDKAAGLYREPVREGRWPAPSTIGPFKTPKEPKQKPRVAVGHSEQEGPSEVATSEDDVSWCGCRDMAGNGEELTGDLQNRDDHVPLEPSKVRDSIRVMLRGQMFTEPKPLAFRDLQRDQDLDTAGYNEPHPQTGFRVVVEVRGE
jgi:serine/threonine protein kinase